MQHPIQAPMPEVWVAASKHPMLVRPGKYCVRKIFLDSLLVSYMNKDGDTLP